MKTQVAQLNQLFSLLLFSFMLFGAMPGKAQMDPIQLTPEQAQRMKSRLEQHRNDSQDDLDKVIQCVKSRKQIQLLATRNRITLRKISPGEYKVKVRVLPGHTCGG